MYGYIHESHFGQEKDMEMWHAYIFRSWTRYTEAWNEGGAAPCHERLASGIRDSRHEVYLQVDAEHILLFHSESADLNKELGSWDLGRNRDGLLDGIVVLFDWASYGCISIPCFFADVKLFLQKLYNAQFYDYIRVRSFLYLFLDAPLSEDSKLFPRLRGVREDF